MEYTFPDYKKGLVNVICSIEKYFKVPNKHNSLDLLDKILKENNILKIKQLVNKTKTNLKTIGLLGYQISEIEIKLQLVGYDLKGNH